MPDHDDQKELIAQIMRAMRGEVSERDRARFQARDEILVAAQKAAIDEVGESLLGIRPEHGDTIYTAHPLMAGVLRQALRRAFEAGTQSVARILIESRLQRPNG